MSTKSVIVLDDSSDEDEEEMAPATDRRNVPLSVSSSSDESDARPSQAKKPRVASSTPDAPATSSSNPTAPKGLNSSSSSTGELESTDELEDSDDQEKIATPQPPPAKTVKKTIATGPSSVEQSDASADSGEDNLDDATTLRFARRDGRMYSDALSFSELQAQQRELERLQAHRKNIVHSPRKTKTGARNTTLSGTKRKAGASVSSGHSNPHSTSKRPVMKKTTSPSPFDFNFPGSSDDASSSGSDEHGTPTISGRAKPMSLRDVVAQERKLARQRKTTTEKSNGSSSSKKVTQKKQKPKPLFWFGAPKQENIIDGTEWSASEPDEDDNDDDDDDDAEENQQQFINEPELLSEASSLESDDKPSSDEEYKPSESKHLVKPLEQNASRSANADKKKNGTPSKPSKKKSRTKKSGKTSTKTRPSSAKAEVHAGTPAQTKTVTDKLAKPRDATDTVMPSTVWRNVSIDVAPPNLLPVASAVALPFLSQCDRPLMTYDEDGDLRSKCKLITHFGKSTQFVSSALVSDDQRITQEDMDNRVTEIITKELPRIQACHKRKTFAIIAEERAKVHAYRAAHDSLHPSKIPKLRSSRLSEVSTLDKSLLNQMKQERLSQRLSLGYKNVWGEEIPVEERLFPVDVNQLPAIRPLSRSTAFIGLKTNVRVEDDPILRYMPYFGDNDDGGDIDVAWYDAIKSDDSNPPSGLDGEVNEYLLRLVIRECGASDLVFNALKKVPGFAQAYSDYSDIKKLDESMRLAARRIKEARDLIANKPADFPLSKVATLEPLLNDQKNSEKALTTRFAPPPTYFDSNLARCHKNRGYGLGLRPTEDYTELMVTYRDMFCRMCYVYHCLEHGIEHPLPSHRVDPINPPLHLSAVALRAKAREEERQDDATPSDQTPESNTPESNSPAVSPPAGSIAPDSTTSISGDNKQITDSLNHNEDAHIDEDIVMEIVSSETLYETATDEDASATVELHETRRSRRSATRMSSLASQSLKHQASKPSRRKPSRTIRVNTYPKVPDESEYLDDSHHAWVKSAVKKSLNANEPCSGECSKAVPLETSVSGDGAANNSSDAVISLSDTELVLLCKLRGIIGDNPCLISAMIKSTTCKEVGVFLESERQSKPIRTSSMDEAALSPDVRSNLNGRKRGRAHNSRSSNNRILLNRTRNNRMKDKGANHEYEPCNHEGACNTMGCSCMSRDHTCEKACSCSRDCPNRFPGCKCSLGNCRTKACPCFVAARECNPDLCFTCGASEVPALIFDEERRNMSALDLGICCNVNILRGLHKKIGVAYSTTHGWGAFALEPIKRGEFIYEYHGALLSQDEAERRGSIYDKMTISFLFDADDDSVVDAIRKGNKSKFANHSAVGQKCKGKVLTVGGEHRISIWAQQDIEKGEELFFDYGYHGETAPDWSQLRIKGAVRQKAAKTKKEEH